jgi:DNA (cytosine-5)-methyltransferase 1
VNRQAGTRYAVRWAKLNASEFGVPQVRERVFLIAHRDGASFRFPAPTHSAADDDGLFSPSVDSCRTAWDAIGDLPPDQDDPALELRGKWGALLPSIPEGQNYLWHTARGGGHPLFGWRTRYWSFLLKLAKHRPSWTIQAQPGTAIGPFHWRSRRLTAQEMCRLQTFPDGVAFNCSRGEVQRMLGNAVPSLIAEVLATEIRSQLLGDPRRSRALKLLPPRRPGIPDAEVVAPLPVSYRALVGDHAPHPGEGRGPATARRPPPTGVAAV